MSVLKPDNDSRMEAMALAEDFTALSDECEQSGEQFAYQRETGEDKDMRIHDYQQQRWNQKYDCLVKFYAEHGHCDVPYNFKRDPSLLHWIKRQRHQHKRDKLGKRSNLTDDRVRLLNILGFNWDSQQSSWSKNFENLKEFYLNNGHFNVPSDHNGDKGRLSYWLRRQKSEYRMVLKQKKPSTKMNLERIEKLKEIGLLL